MDLSEIDVFFKNLKEDKDIFFNKDNPNFIKIDEILKNAKQVEFKT